MPNIIQPQPQLQLQLQTQYQPQHQPQTQQEGRQENKLQQQLYPTMPSKMLKTCLKSVENLSGAQSGDNGLIDSVGILAHDHDDGPVLEGLELGVFGDLILIGKVVFKVLAL